jgi:flagellar hook-associated protein 3 FlgL
MRIGTNQIAEQLLANLNRNQLRLATLQEQIASGRRILRPADDPSGIAILLDRRGAIAEREQFLRNIGDGRRVLAHTETATTQLLDLLQRVQAKAVAGADGSQPPSARQTMATEVNSLLETLLDLANTQADGAYLFGGTETGTAPYAVTRVGGEITAVTANPKGVSGTIAREIERGITVQVNMPGSEVFTKTTNLFTALIALRDDLRAGNQAGIQAAITTLQTGLDQVLTASAVLGARTRRLELTEARLELELLTLRQGLSRVEDTDIAEASVQLEAARTVRQAALASGGAVLRASLLNLLQ